MKQKNRKEKMTSQKSTCRNLVWKQIAHKQRRTKTKRKSQFILWNNNFIVVSKGMNLKSKTIEKFLIKDQRSMKLKPCLWRMKSYWGTKKLIKRGFIIENNVKWQKNQKKVRSFRQRWRWIKHIKLIGMACKRTI